MLRKLLLYAMPWILSGVVWAGEPDPFADLDRKPAGGKATTSKDADPFADLDKTAKPKDDSVKSVSEDAKKTEESNAFKRFFKDNFAFRKEIISQFSYSREKDRINNNFLEAVYSRQSLGFEMQKKFSDKTSTIASFDLQMRFVRRDNFFEAGGDIHGAENSNIYSGNENRWAIEIHNAYWDFYNVFNWLLNDAQKAKQVGRFNFRLGRFYLPFGINQQSDTHGTLMQLSNEWNFGYDRDQYAGFWGAINNDLNYDLYYETGSGHDYTFKGQKGLIGARLRLSNKYLNEYGVEAGFSFVDGERIAHGRHSYSKASESAGHILASDTGNTESKDSGKAHAHHGPALPVDTTVDTLRFGLDARYRHSVPSGSLTFTGEWSAGRDEYNVYFRTLHHNRLRFEDQNNQVYTELYQLDYLSRKRNWGLGAQASRYWQDFDRVRDVPKPRSQDVFLIGEFTWYFRNDIGNSNLHWIKLNVERQLERQSGPRDTMLSIQYYRYW